MPVERIPSTFSSFSELVTITGPGSWMQIGGQVAFDASRTGVIDGDVAAQAELIFDQLDALLRRAGSQLSDLVKLHVYLIDIADFEAFAAVRGRRFPDGPPASATVAVSGLVLGARIEIEGLAFRPDPAAA